MRFSTSSGLEIEHQSLYFALMSGGARKSLDSSMCTITCSEELEQLPGETSGFVPKQDHVGFAEAEHSWGTED